MRSDIVPGARFPDYELTDHTRTRRRLSELQGIDPMILILSRGHYCPKDHQQHLEMAAFYSKINVAYTKIVTISTDNILETNEFRDGVGAQWTFLSDSARKVQQDLDIQEYTHTHHNPLLGHACFKNTTPQGKIIPLDPWIKTNPVCPEELKQVDKVDLMLVSHGHFDHVADAVEIAKATKPTVVAIVELAGWLKSRGVENTVGINKGGTVDINGIKVTMTHAIHTSGTEDGSYGGDAAGFVIEFENGRKLYHAGDTCAFSDMAIIGELYRPDVALLPIGDFYTMAPKEAAIAVRMLGVKHVIPMHYGTFPILTGPPEALRESLQTLGLHEVEVIAMKPGETV